MSAGDILKAEEGVYLASHWGAAPGARLTMRDGSVWFHPYSGGAPKCLTPAPVFREGGARDGCKV